MLNNTSTLKYGYAGRQIPITTFRSSVTAKPELDEAGRSVKYVSHTLDVTGWIAGDPNLQDDQTDVSRVTTGYTLTQMRQVLTRPGLVLTYQHAGYGALVVNDAAANRYDVANGPTPMLLGWEPVGNDLGCRIHWQVTTHLAECVTLVSGRAVPLAYNVEFDITQDQDGYMEVRYSGYIEIALGGPFDDDVDRYTPRVVPGCPDGFQRTHGQRRISKDKRRIDFAFSDKELPNPLQPDVTTVRASHRISSGLKMGNWSMWNCVLSADYVLRAGVPKSEAIQRFQMLFESKVRNVNATAAAQVKQAQGGNGGVPLFGVFWKRLNAAATAKKKPLFLPENMTIEDDVFGRGTRFTLAYRLLGTTLENAAAAAGMWEPVANASFQAMKTVLQTTAWDPRRKVKYDRFSEVVIDPCTTWPAAPPKPQVTVVLRPPKPSQFGGQAFGGPEPFGGDGGGVAVGGGGDFGGGVKSVDYGDPDPNSTWVAYQAELEAIEDDHLVRHKPLADTVADTPNAKQNSRYGGLLVEAGAGQTTVDGPTEKAAGTTPPDVIQQVSAPSYTIRLTGYAVRVFHRPSAPRIMTVNGVAVRQASRVVRETVLARSHWPIYAVAWDITYLVPSAPVGNYPVPENPLVSFAGSNAAAPKG